MSEVSGVTKVSSVMKVSGVSEVSGVLEVGDSSIERAVAMKTENLLDRKNR